MIPQSAQFLKQVLLKHGWAVGYQAIKEIDGEADLPPTEWGWATVDREMKRQGQVWPYRGFAPWTALGKEVAHRDVSADIDVRDGGWPPARRDSIDKRSVFRCPRLSTVVLTGRTPGWDLMKDRDDVYLRWRGGKEMGRGAHGSDVGALRARGGFGKGDM